jgi:hypothetical protein
MSRSIPICLLVMICASTILASAQVASVPAGTIAYVYVSKAINNSTTTIKGYSAASDGSLTAIPGSPFADNVNYMAVNGNWLFGIENTPPGDKIHSLAIAPNGSLELRDIYAVTSGGGGLTNLYLDHTGTTLYGDLYNGNNDFLSFSIDQSTGQLTSVGDLAGGPQDNSPVSFIGNNRFAYSSSCYHFDPLIFGVQRNGDGSFSYLATTPPLPTAKSGDFYCPWRAAADPRNHLAIAVKPYTLNWVKDGPVQLATYTADDSGNLTTTSTYSNMPIVRVGSINNYWMSPNGKYLAIGGTGGLEIFHFHGANPITKFTGPLTHEGIDQLWWDNSSHLYALSPSAQKLYVFTVTAKGARQAPGSPHRIVSPVNLIVLPKT